MLRTEAGTYKVTHKWWLLLFFRWKIVCVCVFSQSWLLDFIFCYRKVSCPPPQEFKNKCFPIFPCIILRECFLCLKSITSCQALCWLPWIQG